MADEVQHVPARCLRQKGEAGMLGSGKHAFHGACVYLAMGGVSYDGPGCGYMVAPLLMLVVAAFDLRSHGHAMTGWAH